MDSASSMVEICAPVVLFLLTQGDRSDAGNTLDIRADNRPSALRTKTVDVRAMDSWRELDVVDQEEGGAPWQPAT